MFVSETENFDSIRSSVWLFYLKGSFNTFYLVFHICQRFRSLRLQFLHFSPKQPKVLSSHCRPKKLHRPENQSHRRCSELNSTRSWTSDQYSCSSRCTSLWSPAWKSPELCNTQSPASLSLASLCNSSRFFRQFRPIHHRSLLIIETDPTKWQKDFRIKNFITYWSWKAKQSDYREFHSCFDWVSDFCSHCSLKTCVWTCIKS